MVFQDRIMALSKRAIYMFACVNIHLLASTTLDFSNSNLTEVPPAPGNSTVTKLYLNRNIIRELQRHSLKGYTDIVEIYMASNGLRVIHDGVFGNISTLIKLHLTGNKIIKLPADFGPSTTGMKAMNLESAIKNPAILTHPYFGAFTNLRTLDIAAAGVGNVNYSFYPPNIRLLAMNMGTMDMFPLLSSLTPFVSYVSFNNHRIEEIPEEAVEGLSQLRYLTVRRNRLMNFPNVSNCKRLQSLILTTNEISFIPRQHIGGLERIKELQLAENKLTNMPNVSNLSTLRIFNIGSNLISEIPESYIVGLLNMEVFTCDKNKILFLPNMIKLFPRLQILHIQGNKLKTLSDLYDITSLSTLTVAENPLVCNQSLCWLRMWPWMRPSLAVLQDKPLCDQPASLDKIEVLRFHPTDMECYKGVYLGTKIIITIHWGVYLGIK